MNTINDEVMRINLQNVAELGTDLVEASYHIREQYSKTLAKINSFRYKK